MSFSNNSCAGRKPKAKTPGDPKPVAVLNAFQMGSWGQIGEPAPAKPKAAPQRARRAKPKTAKRAKPAANRQGNAKTKARAGTVKPRAKVSEKGQKSKTRGEAMAHEEKYVGPTASKQPKPGNMNAPETAPSKTNPSARLSRIGGNDAGKSKTPTPAKPGEVNLRTAAGSTIDNENFQSWITRVRVLNQNDADHQDSTQTGGNAGKHADPATTATSQPPTASLTAKPVQSSRDWSQTAKKALDEMLVTLPDDQPTDWSAAYPRQSTLPPPPPPARPALPLYAKLLLPFMGLALSAYPLYFAAQKGWIPGLSGKQTAQYSTPQSLSGQTPAPAAEPRPVQPTTGADRSGFTLAAAPPAMMPSAEQPAPGRAILLRPEGARIATNSVKPAETTGTPAASGAVGWTTQISRQSTSASVSSANVSSANAASVPITVENVVAVGPTLAPVAARSEPRRATNSSVELPNATLAVGGPVIPVNPADEAAARVETSTGPLMRASKPAQMANIAPARPIDPTTSFVSVAPVAPVAPVAARQIQPRPSPATNSVSATPVENTLALMQRGSALLKLGDVVSARLFFELAAKKGDPAGALAAGRTYDPLYLTRLGVRGIRSDPAKALIWYRTARRGGNTGSSADILRLESAAAR